MADLSKEDKNKLKQELVKVGLTTLREAKKNAPVDTGRLRASITIADSDGIIQEPEPEALPKDAVDIPQGDFVVRVGTNVDYAPFIEFGTGEMDAQPFLRPARQSAFQQRDISL